MSTAITKRLYAGESDLETIAELWSACEAFDKLNESMSVSELRQAIKNPSFDTKQGLCLWEDVNGELIAFAWLSVQPSVKGVIDGSIGFIVHPRARGAYLKAQILAWGLQSCITTV